MVDRRALHRRRRGRRAAPGGARVSAKIIPAIMSGGAGTRLWPLSTEAQPKQFHTLGWDRTLFAQTLARVSGPPSGAEFQAPVILCGPGHVASARAALGMMQATFVIEPAPRNTAAIAAIAAAVAVESDPEALLLLQPADHVVADVGAFHEAILRGIPYAWDGIVTLGVAPTRPATNYGYIKRGRGETDSVFAIEAFKEKPDEAAARAYLASGDYFWNAGIFLFHPQTLLREFEASADVRDSALMALERAKRSGDEIRLDADAFSNVPALPIDIAVMEKTGKGFVVACDMGWADIGTWDEAWRRAPRDADGVAVLGPAAAADVSKIQACGVKAMAIEGEDLVAVATPHGVAILPRARVGEAARLLA